MKIGMETMTYRVMVGMHGKESYCIISTIKVVKLMGEGVRKGDENRNRAYEV